VPATPAVTTIAVLRRHQPCPVVLVGVLLKFLMVFAPLSDGRAAAQQDGPTLIAGAKDMMASSPPQTRGRPGSCTIRSRAHERAHDDVQRRSDVLLA